MQQKTDCDKFKDMFVPLVNMSLGLDEMQKKKTMDAATLSLVLGQDVQGL